MAENELNGVFLYSNNIDIVRALVETGNDRCLVYDAIFDFVRQGIEPKFQNPKLTTVFDFLKPLLQSVRRKGIIANKKMECGGERRLKKFDNYIAKNFGVDSENFEENYSEEFLSENEVHNENINKNISENINININKEREIYKERESASFFGGIPTLDDVKNFILENDLDVVPEIFFHFYNGKRWLVNGEPFDWKEKILEWVARGAGKKNQNQFTNFAGGSVTGVGYKSQKLANERDFSNATFDHMFDDLDDIDI